MQNDQGDLTPLVLVKKFSDHNGQRKVVFGLFKIQDYVQVHKRLISVCTQPYYYYLLSLYLKLTEL